MKRRSLRNAVCLILMAAILTLTGCAGIFHADKGDVTDYSQTENWAYAGIGENKKADVFLICPTVDMKDEFNMSLSDEETKASFLGALNMERGIYEESARLYAPYYQQAAMKVYSLETADREEYFDIAYADVSKAFSYYLEN